jgi:hypothetical protein
MTMKSFKPIVMLLLWAALLFTGIEACAQAIVLPDKPGQLYEVLTPVLLSAVLTALSYLTYLIPGLNKIKDTQVRVIVFVLASTLGFVYYGFSFVTVFAAAFMSQGWYLFIFKPLGLKTPKVALDVPVTAPAPDLRTSEEIEEGRKKKDEKMGGQG